MMEPRLEEAKSDDRVVLYVDAAHFVFGAFLGWVWSVVRFWVRTGAGRQRFNVLGALNALTHEMITMMNTGSVNNETVQELLRKIKTAYPHQPITLILDHARYQRAKVVQALAEQLSIELMFLSAYSPNLNLIERFWKFVKKRCLYLHFPQKC